MAYTPELSYENSCTLRRLAWFLGKPMTSTLEAVIELLSVRMSEINPGEVCASCRDRSRCERCAFNPENAMDMAAMEGK
jgi:recombinational DNA repair protein RecR